MAAYEFDGEKYKKASRHQKEWGKHLIAELHLKGNETVLDLGCGDGMLSKQIAQLVPNGKVIGIDASSGMLKTARKLQKNNLSFLQMDINEMDFSDTFDIIFSNAALHWVLDHPLLLKHAFLALKKSGRIHWNFAGAGTCAAFCDVVRAKMKKPEYASYFDNFTWPWFMTSGENYQALMTPVGFSKIEILEKNEDRYFSDTQELIGWIDQPSLVPFLAAVPEEKKAAFRQDVIQSMIERTKQPDGTCFETFRRLNITAVK